MDRLILSAPDEVLASAWERFCGDVAIVEVLQASILDADVDAIVSPANSFGFMDGGIDALYLDHFGREVMGDLRRAIVRERHGELLVGDALIIETGSAELPWMIAAPTMRVPMRLGETVNPYLAARAVFLLVEHGRMPTGPYVGEPIREHVRRVAMPGLGTGVGQVSGAVCAHQVRQAIDDVLLAGYRMPRSWAEASERHQLLYTDRPTRLQR
jgi:O-acetyl-ADP-ribose deacetylase (regulator of RNase III)